MFDLEGTLKSSSAVLVEIISMDRWDSLNLLLELSNRIGDQPSSGNWDREDRDFVSWTMGVRDTRGSVSSRL